MNRVIAEIGINHDGSLTVARELIHAAAESRCDSIKFQYRNLERSYSLESGKSREIGDEIIVEEIKRNFLSPSEIMLLVEYANSLSINSGISFFTYEDYFDFTNEQHEQFSFYKVPSAELLNEKLLQLLVRTGKEIYISTGMHSETEIEAAFQAILNFENWTPMHCISNYPVALHNANMGYISYLRAKWNREVGFSSHDENWETVLIALSLGAKTIERHITLSKESRGLDHSTSSTPDEFLEIVNFSMNMDLILGGDGPRQANQGELLNRQNLGRSYYSNLDQESGAEIKSTHFSYLSPGTGLGYREFTGAIGKKIVRPINKGEVLSASHLSLAEAEPTVEEITKAKIQHISIPVRLSDYESIHRQIPVGSYEFHLSFEEVASDLRINIMPQHRFSVHLPDYISPTELIDPFSRDESIRSRSNICIERTMDFANWLGQESGRQIPVVASLSSRTLTRAEFYPQVKTLFQTFKNQNSFLTLQWLPPIAWYFGGSIKLEQVNAEVDVNFILDENIDITMDTSHLILGRNAFGFDAVQIVKKLSSQIKHVHIADAAGIDGEGLQFDPLSSANADIFLEVGKLQTLQVVEVWQGHLDNYAGFKAAIKLLGGEIKVH